MSRFTKNWKRPTEELPKQHTKVKALAYDDRVSEGIFLCTDNWELPGYRNDLFNDDIVVWRELTK